MEVGLRLSDEAIRRITEHINVSILVFMEVGLRHFNLVNYKLFYSLSFNPCFYGSWS